MSKLDGYKAGDRFSVTMQGSVVHKPDSAGDMLVRFDGTASGDYIFAAVADAPTFQITRIEPAFRVGDRVRAAGYDTVMSVIAFLKDSRVVCEYEAGDTTGVMARDPSCFTHA